MTSVALDKVAGIPVVRGTRGVLVGYSQRELWCGEMTTSLVAVKEIESSSFSSCAIRSWDRVAFASCFSDLKLTFFKRHVKQRAVARVWVRNNLESSSITVQCAVYVRECKRRIRKMEKAMYNADTTVQTLQCRHYRVDTTMQTLPCRRVRVDTTMQTLSCRHYPTRSTDGCVIITCRRCNSKSKTLAERLFN